MAEIRSVSVHLDADVASYVAKMRLAGAETDKAFGRSERGISTTNARLGETEKTLGRVSLAERRLGSDVDSTRIKVDTGAKSLDRYSGRLGIFLDLALGIGPALVPIGAVAVPAVTALGTGVLGAAAGFGVAKLAVLGVGNALKAVNKAAIEPTTENLKAAHQALNQLPPSARAFVFELQAMRPEVQGLQRIAANGLFPGAEQGLHSLTRDLPIVRNDVRAISGELGILARDTGRSLASDRWKPFLRFVGTEAPVQLGVLGRSVGDVAHGVTELLMGFTPLTHDVDRGILRVAQDFDRWASSLNRTRGYLDFMAYVRENGPRVVDLLDNTATAFFDISRAAAPLGGPVLDTLNLFLRVVDALAKSDLGTPIFTGLVALRLFTRAEQLWAATSKSAVGQFIIGQKNAVLAIRATTTAEQRAAMTAGELAAAQGRTTAGWATLRGGALKAGVGVAGLAAVSSGLTDKMHLTNTATLAMAGSLVGPWGTAIGAGVGLLLDFKGGQDRSAASVADFTQTLNQQTGAITHQTEVMAAQVLQEDGAADAAEKLGINTHLLLQATLGHADAQKQLQAQLDQFTGVTQPGYIAGGRGMYSVDQEQALAAGKLGTEVGKVSDKLKGNQADFVQLQGILGHNIDVTERTSRAHRLLGRDLKVERQAASDAVDKWQIFDNTLNDADKTMGQFLNHMLQRAKALEQFGNNALRAARRGLDQGLIKSLRQMGEEGALRLRQLANGSDEQIGRANHAFRTFEGAVDDTKSALTQATSRQWLIKVQAAEAHQELQAIALQLAGLHDKTIRVTTVRSTGGHSVAGDAEGGTIPGPRYPYGDKVLRYLAPGEEVISNRHGQADRHRPLLKAINRSGMADGGTVTTSTSRVSVGPYAGSGLGAAADDAVRGLRGLKASLADATKELDQERQHRQQLAQARQQVISTARDGFRSDFLGVTPDGIWGDGGSDPASILRGDIRNARHFRQDIRKLRRRGISAGLASQVTTLAGADQLAGMSPAELRELNRLYARRQKASQAAGVVVGNAADGAKLDAVRGEIQKTNHEVRRLTAAVKHMEHENAKNAKATGDAVGDKINGAARDARQRARP